MEEVTPDPIPARVTKSGLTVGLETFITVPASRASAPEALINQLYHADDGTDRIFVNDTRGQLWLIDGGVLDPQPFLDMTTARADAFYRGGPEQGARGTQEGFRSFAFHPDYENPGRRCQTFANQSQLSRVEGTAQAAS